MNGAKTEEQHDMEETLASISEKMNLTSLKNLTLDQSKEATVYIADYAASKVCSGIEECRSRLLFGECENSEYLQFIIMSCGGLKSS